MNTQELHALYDRELKRRIHCDLKTKIVETSDNTHTIVMLLPITLKTSIEANELPTHKKINNIALAFNEQMNETVEQQNKLIEQTIIGFKNIHSKR